LSNLWLLRLRGDQKERTFAGIVRICTTINYLFSLAVRSPD
jgi:hypothetical protein